MSNPKVYRLIDLPVGWRKKLKGAVPNEIDKKIKSPSFIFIDQVRAKLLGELDIRAKLRELTDNYDVELLKALEKDAQLYLKLYKQDINESLEEVEIIEEVNLRQKAGHEIPYQKPEIGVVNINHQAERFFNLEKLMYPDEFTTVYELISLIKEKAKKVNLEIKESNYLESQIKTEDKKHKSESGELSIKKKENNIQPKSFDLPTDIATILADAFINHRIVNEDRTSRSTIVEALTRNWTETKMKVYLEVTTDFVAFLDLIKRDPLFKTLTGRNIESSKLIITPTGKILNDSNIRRSRKASKDNGTFEEKEIKMQKVIDEISNKIFALNK